MINKRLDKYKEGINLIENVREEEVIQENKTRNVKNNS